MDEMIMLEKNVDDECPMSIHDDVIRIDFVRLGEGENGSYDPSNPNDVEYLRFDAFVANPDADEEFADPWIEIEDGSYCTCIPVKTKEEDLEKHIRYIHSQFREIIDSYEDYLYGSSVKKLGERLSWLGSK